VPIARNSLLANARFGANALGQQRTYGYASLRPNARFRLTLRMSAAVRRDITDKDDDENMAKEEK